MEPPAIKSRNTRQRAVILDILRQTKAHPTAEGIYHEARKTLPNISLGTVYRNLNFLRGQGLAREIRPHNESSSRFDCNSHPHAHFHCRQCNGMTDLPLPPSLGASDWEKERVSRVDFVDLLVLGSCAGCAPQPGPQN